MRRSRGIFPVRTTLWWRRVAIIGPVELGQTVHLTLCRRYAVRRFDRYIVRGLAS